MPLLVPKKGREYNWTNRLYTIDSAKKSKRVELEEVSHLISWFYKKANSQCW